LRDEIIAAQKMMRVCAISRKGYKKVIQRLLVSVRMQKESYGSRIDWLCQKSSTQEEDSG
jgi:hypothetical protein